MQVVEITCWTSAFEMSRLLNGFARSPTKETAMTYLNGGEENGDGNDLLDNLLQSALAEHKERQRRRDNPYVADMIRVLAPHHSNGVPRRNVIDTVEAIRKSKSLPMPRKFDDAVQSAFNHHCLHSLVFIKRHAPTSDGLFFSPQGKGTGIWAVDIKRATAWLIAKNSRK
jgi:hypothetical protein